MSESRNRSSLYAKCIIPAFFIIVFQLASCKSGVVSDDKNTQVDPTAQGKDASQSPPVIYQPPTVYLPDVGENSLVMPVYPEAGICASENAEAGLLPVYLAFAFDVSGSMGKMDLPYHDPKLKWDPVVAATKAFFTATSSKGLYASMTFFPSMEPKCVASSYVTPIVPFTELPSTLFGQAMDDYRKGEFRGSTPTLQVMQGVLEFVLPQREANPGRYVVVLVTDGRPQGCSLEATDAGPAVVNDIPNVVSLIKKEFVPKDLPVYVVGVKNPPGGPDQVTEMGDVAIAGGTQKAFIIETGDPAKTATDFKATIEKIRGYSISCSLKIPKPTANYLFDKTKVAVSYTSKGTTTKLTYDAACQTKNAWQYDDPANPKLIKLCADVCKTLQDDSTTKINIEFTCEPVIIIPG